MQDREHRRAVLVQARMRNGSEWADVLIHNVSAHGMLLHALAPPAPGTAIEIRKAAMTLAARVIWLNGRMFGVRLSEALDFEDLIRSARSGLSVAARGGGPGGDRRRASAARIGDTGIGRSRSPIRSRSPGKPAGVAATAILIALILSLGFAMISGWGAGATASLPATHAMQER